MSPASSGIPVGDLPFGVLGRPHGVTGEMVLRPYHAKGFGLDRLHLPLDIALVQPGGTRSCVIRALRRVSDGFLIRLEGIGSREQAALLTGCELRIPKAVFPPLGDAEFYVEDLIGCEVQDVNGTILGKVEGVYWNGAHDVMSLNGGEHLIPVVPEFIVAVDPSKKIATVNTHE